MDLFLFRHGPSEERDPRRWPDDADRPLSATGERETRDAARGLVRVADAVDRIISSPAERARRTAEIIRGEWENAPAVQFWPEAEPGATAAPVLNRLRSVRGAKGKVLVVGHEPTLSQLVGYSLVGDEVSFARLSKAGGAALEFSREPVPGGARLNWLLSRKQLIELGK